MLWNDTRAQSIQIGAVLLFGILIILLSTWQAFGIPNQNEGIEFNHNQEAQQQMTELRTTANSMPDASVTRSATIDLGVRYPSRTIFRNPPPATGNIQTLDTDNDDYAVQISNAEPTEKNLANLWEQKTGDPATGKYTTGAIQYNPRYNEYRNPPRTIYEHSVVYNKFDREGTSLSISDQSLVEGDRISLISLDGSLDGDRVDSTSVDFKPISTQTQTVTIKPEGEPLTLDIPTRLDTDEWESLTGENHEVMPLEDIDGEGDPFADDEDIRTLRVSVDANREEGIRDSYRLQLAKVGVGVDTKETKEEYLTDGPNDTEQVTEGETEQLRVEVRDEFNKPISGVTVYAQNENDGLDETSATTNDRGQAQFEYTAPTGADSDTVELSFRDLTDEDVEFDEDRPEDVAISLDIRDSEDNDGTTTYGLSYVRDQIEGQNGITFDEEDNKYIMNTGANPDLITQTKPPVQEAVVDYSLEQDDQYAAFDEGGSDDETDSEGEASVGIVADEAQDGDETIVHANSGGAGDKITIEFESGAFFEVEIIDTNSPVVQNDDLEVQFSVENVGDEAATQDIRLEFEGRQEDSEPVELEPGESDTDTLEYEEVDEETGEYEVTVGSNDDSDTETVNVIEEGDPFFEVTIDEDASTLDVEEGEIVEVVADVFNSGADGDGEVELIISDGVGSVDEEPVSIDADESEEVRLEWETGEDDTGEYTATVDADPGDSDDTDVTVGTDDPIEGSFSGLVEDGDGDPIAETDISFEGTEDGGDTFEETVETSDDGTYTVEDIEEGTYDITASADGFQDDTESDVEVTAGEETRDIDFTLEQTGSGFENVVANDINEEDGTQSLEITLDGDLNEDESITIDLSEAEQQNDQPPQPAFVSYSGEDNDVTVMSGNGSSTFESYDEGEEAIVEYVSSGDSDGDTIEIELQEIEVQGGGNVPDNLTAVFSRSDRTDTAEDTFGVE